MSAPSDSAVITAKNLTLEEGTATAYRALDFTVAQGGVLAVTGPSGSGRTALLLTLAGRMKPSSGELEVAGCTLPRQAAAARKRVALAETAAVNPLDDTLSIEQHVAEALTLASPWWRPMARRSEIDAVLDAVRARVGEGRYPPLHGREPVSDLSPLTRMLLGIALALVSHPAVLVVDDVDALRGSEERTRAWSALLSLAASVDHPLTVAASCESARELSELTASAATEQAPVIISLDRTSVVTEGL